jgi:gliding motility-associated-like protein
MNGRDLKISKKKECAKNDTHFTTKRLISLVFLLLSAHFLAAQNPSLSAIEPIAVVYDEGQTPTPVTETVLVTDADSPLLNSATVQITGNYSDTEDLLLFTNTAEITGTYDAATGTLLLTGPASPAEFTSALRNVLYQNSNENNPSTLVRTITIAVTDEATNTASVVRNIQVNGVNDPPVGVDDSFVMYEDTELDCGCILINDSDPDGDDLIALHGGQPPANGTVIDEGGFFVYKPNPNFYGTDSFTYFANDGTENSNETTVHITVLPVNDPPIALDDAATTDEDTPLDIQVLVNDIDIDDVLVGSMIVVVDPPAHGTVAVNTTTGAVTYVPNENYNGNDQFTYQVKDASDALSNVGTVAIVIDPVNDAPIANPDAASTPEEMAVEIDVLANDVDVDNTLDGTGLVIVTPPTHGTAVIEPGGLITYTPEENFTGPDTFEYRVKDALDAISAPATVTVTVTPVNDPPVANPDIVITPEDTPIAIPALANDIDIDNDLAYVVAIIVSNPSHGTATIDANGNILYSPAQNYFGDDSFTYQIKDPAGTLSNVTSINVTVTPVNDPPIANPEAVTTPEEVTKTIAVLVNDTDVDNSLVNAQVSVSTNPAHGSAVVESSGVVVYTPEKDFTGTDSFSYQVTDPAGATSAPALVTVTVTPVNDRPVAVDDQATTDENTAVDIDILANDFDIDNDLVPSSVVLTAAPIHGTVSIHASGQVTYTPSTDFVGSDAFQYTVADAEGLVSLPATVTVSVVEVENKAPVAVDDAVTNSSLTQFEIDVLANDYDQDGPNEELTLVSVTQPTMGTVSIVNGKVVYKPAGMQSTTVTFTYTIQDADGLTDEAVVTIENTFLPLIVSEGFSPNADNNNDTWYIQGIEYYPNNVVKVFDRWGFLVYQNEHYNNSSVAWDGRGNAGQHAGKLLDQGTYYYILEPGGEMKTLNGYVVIVR